VHFTNYDLESVNVCKAEFDRRTAAAFALSPLPSSEKELSALLSPYLNKSGDDFGDMIESLSLAKKK
jgi:hypothetical protein